LGGLWVVGVGFAPSVGLGCPCQWVRGLSLPCPNTEKTPHTPQHCPRTQRCEWAPGVGWGRQAARDRSGWAAPVSGGGAWCVAAPLCPLPPPTHTHARGVPGVMPVIGFPPIVSLTHRPSRASVFPIPIPQNPQNPSVLRPFGALFIGIRSAGTPLTHTHTHTHDTHRRCTSRAQ
jgi:hypothetical protein